MTRLFTRTFAAVFVMTAVITGCQEAEPAPPPAGAEAPGEPEPAPAARWESMGSGEGSALLLVQDGGEPQFQLTCLHSPARLVVDVAEFRPIGSEERLTLGVGDEAFALVADPTAPGPGVHAEGAVDPDLLTRLETTREISAVYGAQRFGPHPAPEPEALQAFVQTCRSLAEDGPGA